MSDTSQQPTTETDGVDQPTDAGRDINVRIDDMTKIYQEDDGGEVVAVEDLSIDINRGEFLVFVGPSGCGKTTTLRTVAGLETPTEGRIIIEDNDVTGLDPRERDIAMVFQNYALYPHKTVRQNLAFPLEVRNFPDDEITRRVDEAAELLDIPELLDRKPGALSGGQQQRVALGRAIVREPAVFLMDEPLSNLDAKLRVQMRTELNELHQRVGKTTIYVTHDQAEAMTLGDRVVVMNDGELQQIGEPQYLYDNPVNRFVAGFIGEPPMNFFTVDFDGSRVSNEVFDFELPADMAERANSNGASGTMTFGIRPEDLDDIDVHDVDANADRVFEAYVKVLEPMGSDKFLTLTPPGADEPEFTARVDPESDVEQGATITLAADLGKSHLFDDAGTNVTN